MTIAKPCLASQKGDDISMRNETVYEQTLIVGCEGAMETHLITPAFSRRHNYQISHARVDSEDKAEL